MYFCNDILSRYLEKTEEEGAIMGEVCGSLKQIIGKSPEEVLHITEQATSIPVDISAILAKLHMSEAKIDFTEIEQALFSEDEDKMDISGMVLLSGDKVGIFYNEKDGINRQRFTMAHELGHCCLNGEKLADSYIEFRCNMVSDDEMEVAANTFAGKLLIPEPSLRKVYEKLTIPVVDSLAKIFQVSQQVMKERLKMLHMDYFDPSINEMVVFGED